MNKYEVLQCIYSYLDKQDHVGKPKGEECTYYLSNINPNIWLDEGTADPAYYEDYKKICRAFFPENTCSVEEGFQYAGIYLNKYNELEHRKYASNIDEVVEVFSRCTLSEWIKIYEIIQSKTGL